MKELLDYIGDGIRHLLAGCYGVDLLSRHTLVASLAVFIISLVFGSRFCYLLSLLGVIISWYRILSGDLKKRSLEGRRYEEVLEKAGHLLSRQRKKLDHTRDFCYFDCPGCGQEVRVPKGVGHIRITCPKCHTQFDRTV